MYTFPCTPGVPDQHLASASTPLEQPSRALGCHSMRWTGRLGAVGSAGAVGIQRCAPPSGAAYPTWTEQPAHTTGPRQGARWGVPDGHCTVRWTRGVVWLGVGACGGCARACELAARRYQPTCQSDPPNELRRPHHRAPASCHGYLRRYPRSRWHAMHAC